MEWDLDGITDYVRTRDFRRVALQFPDELLPQANWLYQTLTSQLKAADDAVQVFLLADTTFSSLDVDEVAAEHVDADCVVHFGHASLSPVSKLPAYFVFPSLSVSNPEALASHVLDVARNDTTPVVVLLDLAYVHIRGWLASRLQAEPDAKDRIELARMPPKWLEPAAPATDAQIPANGGATHASRNATAGSAASGTAGSNVCCTLDAAGATCRHDADVRSNDAASTSATLNPAGHTPHTGCQHSGHAAPISTASSDQLKGTGGCGDTEASEGQQACRGAGCVAVQADESDGARAVGGTRWSLPSGCKSERDCRLLWVGPAAGGAALTELLMTYSACAWSFYDPATGAAAAGAPPEVARRLMRRHFLVEKAKNAAIIGILVGTLGVAGYLDVIERLRQLARGAGKKTYTMMMGKPNPQKLANFAEVEVWVQVAESQSVILDCKEYFAPIITPFEAEVALLDLPWDPTRYQMGFVPACQTVTDINGTSSSPRFSLIDGSYHETSKEGIAEADHGSLALAVHADRALQLATTDAKHKSLVQASNAADFMMLKRSFLGAPSPLVGSEVKVAEAAVPGLSGRAASYASETCPVADA